MAKAKISDAGNVKLKLTREEAQGLYNILRFSGVLLEQTRPATGEPYTSHQDEDAAWAIHHALRDGAGLEDQG